jgi:hypothetical protein
VCVCVCDVESLATAKNIESVEEVCSYLRKRNEKTVAGNGWMQILKNTLPLKKFPVKVSPARIDLTPGASDE